MCVCVCLCRVTKAKLHDEITFDWSKALTHDP